MNESTFDKMIDEALATASDTKACVIGPGAVESSAKIFRELFPEAGCALIVDDVNTKRVAANATLAQLKAAGVKVAEHTINPDGTWFHATYDKVEEVREAIAAAGGAIPVAVGSGTINDLVKRASDELGLRYMVVGTAASMDGFTAANAAITKDGMKQTLSCRAPLGCIVDSVIAAKAPPEMTASGYADLIAKIPAGADWIIADLIGSEALHPLAWQLVQGPLRDTLANPRGCAAGDEREVRKLCEGLVMSGFAMQAMDSSRPASGTEHQISHYWDMEDLSVNGRPVSHGFKVGIGTLASTATLEFLLGQDLSKIDVEAKAAAWWPSFDAVKATFPAVFPGRPAHVRRAELEFAKKFPTREALRHELTTIRDNWGDLSAKIRAQLMPFGEVREKLEAAGAPTEPEQIGVTRARFRETYAGVPFMRARYFGADLVQRLGLMPALLDRLFGAGGIWDVNAAGRTGAA